MIENLLSSAATFEIKSLGQRGYGAGRCFAPAIVKESIHTMTCRSRIYIVDGGYWGTLWHWLVPFSSLCVLQRKSHIHWEDTRDRSQPPGHDGRWHGRHGDPKATPEHLLQASKNWVLPTGVWHMSVFISCLFLLFFWPIFIFPYGAGQSPSLLAAILICSHSGAGVNTRVVNWNTDI